MGLGLRTGENAMSQETLDLITKERDQYRAILEFIVSGDCPEHDETWNCVKNKTRCSDCLMEYAREEMEKIKGNLTKEGEKDEANR